MRILISNDDGIMARGIKVLAQRLAANPENQVYVCAPDRERSATGHGLTLHKPLRVHEADLGDKIKGAWYTTGTPSDCVKFALGYLLEKQPPDYVVAGINAGANMGSEIFYSGTVSAAMEGVFFDIPSIAVSLSGSGHRSYEPAAEFVAQLLPSLQKAQLSAGKTLLNINVPGLPQEQIKGVLATTLGVREYNDYFEKRVDPRGKVYYWLAGEAKENEEEENTDAWCIANHMISVTPISFNMTDHKLLDKLRGWGQLGKAFAPPQSDGSVVRGNPQYAINKEAK